MSRRKRLHGRRRVRRKSPLLNTSAIDEVTQIAKDEVKNKAITAGARTIAGTVGGTVAGGVILGKTLYDMYKKGQEESGGKVGYMPNPNAKDGGPKHGPAGSGAQFIPDPKSEVTKGKHTGSIWDKKKSDGSKKTSIWGNKKSIT